MKVLQVAHRGYSEFFRDNSIISIKKAIEYKFDMIEFDIQLTKDNKIILFHDVIIKTQNNFHFIIDLTYEEIKSINPNIILLNDVFIMFYEKKIYNFPLYIDIKGTKKIVPILLQQINRYKKSKQQRYFIYKYKCRSKYSFFCFYQNIITFYTLDN